MLHIVKVGGENCLTRLGNFILLSSTKYIICAPIQHLSQKKKNEQVAKKGKHQPCLC